MEYETAEREGPEGPRHVVLRVRAGRYKAVGVYRDARAAKLLRDLLADLVDYEV